MTTNVSICLFQEENNIVLTKLVCGINTFKTTVKMEKPKIPAGFLADFPIFQLYRVLAFLLAKTILCPVA